VSRTYLALTRLYPSSFRDEYGDDLVALFKDQRAAEPAARVWGRAVRDLVLTVPTQHLEAHMHQPSQRALTVGAAAAAVVVLGIGTLIGSVALPALALVIGFGWMSFASWRSNQVVDAPAWWKRVVLGASLIAVVGIATAIPWPDSIDLGGDLAWSLGAVTLITALTLIGSGLVLGALGRRPAPR